MTTTWRFWGWLLAKMCVATAIVAAVYVVLRNTWFQAEVRNGWFEVKHGSFDGVLFGFWRLPMVWIGQLWLCWYDQRYRCRLCARRLRMPVDQGSYSALLLDKPAVEYVCPYGHGKLVIEAWVSDEPAPKWTRYGNIWQELFKQ